MNRKRQTSKAQGSAICSKHLLKSSMSHLIDSKVESSLVNVIELHTNKLKEDTLHDSFR